jgi:hypothetical protein
LGGWSDILARVMRMRFERWDTYSAARLVYWIVEWIYIPTWVNDALLSILDRSCFFIAFEDTFSRWKRLYLQTPYLPLIADLDDYRHAVCLRRIQHALCKAGERLEQEDPAAHDLLWSRYILDRSVKDVCAQMSIRLNCYEPLRKKALLAFGRRLPHDHWLYFDVYQSEPRWDPLADERDTASSP